MSSDASQYEVLEGLIDSPTLTQLFNDIAQEGKGISITVKGGPTATSQSSDLSLQEAKELLDEKMIQALQVRYTFEGQHWCDTLLQREDGLHLIRGQLPQIQS